MYIDSHAHILSHDYNKEEIEAIVKDAKNKGIIAILNNGLDSKSNREIIKLSKEYNILKPVLGFYPMDAIKEESNVDAEIEFIRNSKEVIAIGEVGLDYSYENSKKEKQKEIFQKFIDLSLELNLPIIVHTRKAEKDVVEMLKISKVKKAVFHCFTGNFKLVKEIEDNGWYFSIPTSIEYSSHFQEMVKRISISHIFTETDSPFFHPFKEDKNSPVTVINSVCKIAELKGMEEIEVTKNIYMNYQRVFL